jgi:hypothetical protein
MKKKVFIMAVIVLMSGHLAQAGVSIVKNGSFENNGAISDVNTTAPQYWCSINIPATKFAGKVDNTWKTQGSYSLTLYSKSLSKCNAGDMAVVSQDVYLTEDANQIIFDLKLSVSSGSWDKTKRSAIVMMDGTVVWDSNNWPADANSEYRNQIIDINDFNGIGDANLHVLSVAIKSKVTETVYPYKEYQTSWDFVKFNAHCGGFGYLPEDLNMDCYVDINDLGMLAGQWLATEPNYNDRYDLFIDDSNTINFYDYAVLAAGWLDNSDWQNWQADNCYEVLPLDTDIDNDGVVNFQDFAILANDWMKTKTVGGCLKGDINCSGSVDYKDIAVMADEWLMTSWMYGLE